MDWINRGGMGMDRGMSRGFDFTAYPAQGERLLPTSVDEWKKKDSES